MMGERYVCKLSPKALKKAVEDLNEPEDNEARLAAIDRLKTRFEEEAEGLELIRTDDAFLLRFLRVRKFNEEKAFQNLLNYHRQRKECREVFDAVDDPRMVEYLLRATSYCTLREGRAKDGSFVVMGRIGMGFTEETTALQYAATIFMTCEKVLEQEEAQIYGLTFIDDMSNLGVTLAMQMLVHSRKVLHLIQDCLPARICSLNMVNEALVFDVIYTVISQFLKEKLKQRLTVHGTEFEKLHEKVDPQYLPFYLGGSGPDLNGDWWADQILSSEGRGEDTEL